MSACSLIVINVDTVVDAGPLVLVVLVVMWQHVKGAGGLVLLVMTWMWQQLRW